jgi:hypothetical protein
VRCQSAPPGIAAGRYEVVFEADDRPSGAYFYRLEAEGATRTGTMLLLK